MKKLITVFLAGLLLNIFCLTGKASAQDTDFDWVIENFHSAITVNQNTSMSVVETIEVDFNNLQKHGIFRLIPIKYRTRFGNNLNVHFDLISVTDKNGNKIPVQKSRESENIKLKIGDPDRTISGRQIYVIRYKLRNVITKPTELAEIYWNVTGNGWPVPVLTATAEIFAPGDSIKNTTCFTGGFGSFTADCQHSHDGKSVRFSVGTLQANEGLTIAVAIDPAVLVFPGTLEKTLDFLAANWLYGLPMITLAVMVTVYWTYGRDKQYKNLFHQTGDAEAVPLFEHLTPSLVYSPPKNLSPGEVGVLIDETVNSRDLTAVVIDLARRGFLTIKETTSRGLFSKPDFELACQTKDESGLRKFESEILDMLFGDKRLRKTVFLKKLGEFESAYGHLKSAKDELYRQLVKDGYFYFHPDHVRKGWLIAGGIMIFIGITFMAFGEFFGTMGGWLAAWAGSGIILLIFSPFMPARSALGRNAFREVVGLREWIRLGAWREQIHEKHNFFEEVLPFTIAFGLTDKFIKAFSEAEIKDVTKNMAWYQGVGSFSAANFSSSFGSFGRSVQYSATLMAAHSASRGGSAFGGGGGFSGGGFGGGGGGSW